MMKYIEPMLTVKTFETENICTTASGGVQPQEVKIKTKVNSKDAVSYGEVQAALMFQ